MALMNPYAGSSGDTDMENRLTDAGEGRKERVGCMQRVTWAHVHYHMQTR